MIGSSVSHYTVTRKLGSGGMGVVYEAEDSRLGRQVALKFLPAELEQGAQWLERFQREARAASALNHPNICTVYAIEQHERQHFIVMELLEGETLAQKIGRHPMELGTLLGLAIQITDALATLSRTWEAGYKDVHWARRDPDLALLHGDPEFERMFPEPAGSA